MQAQPVKAGAVDADDQNDDPGGIQAAFSRLRTSRGFLGLPAEIRNVVYELVCDPITTYHTHMPSFARPYRVVVEKQTPLRLPPIIHTCRQIRFEVLSLWLPMHDFTTCSLAGALRWIDNPDPDFNSFISEFTILDGRDMHREGTWEEPTSTGPALFLHDHPIALRCDYYLEAEETGDGTRAYLSFEFFLEAHMLLAPRSKELIESTTRAAFEQKRPITFDKFVLLAEQLLQVPFKIVWLEQPRHPDFCNGFRISLVAGSEDRQYFVFSSESSEEEMQQE